MVELLRTHNFTGLAFKTADNWFPIINKEYYENKPIKYLEIGTSHGSNIIYVSKTYGAHPESKLYCIDPWIDYKDYPEYKNNQKNIYNIFFKKYYK